MEINGIIPVKAKREFTNEDRNTILQFLLERRINGKLQKGSIGAAAAKFNCNRMTISRIWQRACEGFSVGDEQPDVDSLKKHCGRKRRDYSEKLEKLRNIPQSTPTSLKALSRTIGIPKTTLYNMYRRGEIKRESNNIKPHLTDENKRERVEFCLSTLRSNNFQNLYDCVVIDEKCFYMTKLNKSYYLSLDGKGPQLLSERNFLTKIVFVAAVARPRFDASKNCFFDGKIGIWPIVSQELVQRDRSIRAKNKMIGKMKKQQIVLNNQDEMRKSVLEKLYGAICEKWPNDSKTEGFYIQLDKSKSHLNQFASRVVENGSRIGWNIQMKPQPQNSPDFNALNSGFFKSIESLQQKTYWKTIDDLVTVVENAFNDETPYVLENAFLSMRKVMENSINKNGSNSLNLEEMIVEESFDQQYVLDESSNKPMKESYGTLNSITTTETSIKHKVKETPKRKSVENIAMYSCNICSKTFKLKSAWLRHQSVHNEIKYQCDICSCQFRRKRNLIIHMESKHVVKEKTEKTYQCEHCGALFQENAHLLCHKKTHTKTNGGKKEFTNDERNTILQFLLQHSLNGNLNRGSLSAAAAKFDCNRMTISRIWQRACEGFAAGDQQPDVNSLKKHCGRKRIDYSEELEKLRNIPQSTPTSLKALSSTIGIPKTTLYNIYRRGEIKRESNNITPYLTDENKRERVEFCLSTLHTNNFRNLHDCVHVDEKCFYMTKLNKSYYLSLDGKGPQLLSERNFLTKIVFVAAVARPRFDASKNCFFDGKIGIWPIVSQELVQRNRSIRAKNKMIGKMKKQQIVLNNQDEMRKSVLEKLYSAICEKWPNDSKIEGFYIQLDKSKSHLNQFASRVVDNGLKNGWNIQMKPQPQNSPDFNALDSGFFKSIESLQQKTYWKTIDDLVTEVEKAFNDETPYVLDEAFLSSEKAMKCSMKENGSNNMEVMKVEEG